MKYLFFGTLLVSLLATSLLPMMVLAVAPAPATGCTIQVRTVELSGPVETFPISTVVTEANNRWGLICALNSVNIITNWIFIGLVTIAVFLVLIGAYNLMTAAGNTTKVTAGRNYIMYAAIGLLVAFMARVIPSIVLALLG